jgi:signal transduction histidine kinase/CheY-like chemotaxis protein
MHWPVACLSFAAGLEIVMAVVMRTRVRTKMAAPFSLGLLLAAYWAVNYAVDLSTADFNEKLLLLKLRILFLPFVSLIWFEVAYRFAFGQRCLRGWRLLVAAWIPLVTVAVSWFPVHLHALTFREQYWLDLSGPLPLLRYASGPWSVVFYGYSYAVAACALAIFCRALGGTSWDRRARRAILGAFVLAGLLNFAYVRNLLPPIGLNYTPVFAPVIYGLLAVALWHGRMLDLAPVARSALIENLEEMLLVLDSSGEVVDLNRSAAVGLRLVPAAVLGRPVEEVLAAWPGLLSRLQSDPAGKGELAIDGVVHEISFLPVTDQRNRPQARILMLRNISDRKKIEEDFQRAKEVAEAADQAKSSFLATISHEIRTPMNAVVGFTHLLQSTTLSAEQREYLNLIEQGGRGLLVIIDDVLDYSKITSGRLELEEAPCQIAELAGQVCAMLMPQTQKRGITLQWNLDPSAPAVIVGDVVRLGQILTNLIGNAIKFTERGSVDVWITRRPPGAGEPVKPGRCQLEFLVRDTGVGIAPEALERIFRPFSQADNSITRRFGGTGLGLAITRRLCELMHGELSVQSEPGRGSVFSARVEVGLAPEDESAAAALVVPLVAGLGDRSLRILVFEDDRLNQRVLGALLKKLGHRAHFVDSGAEGLAIVFTESFDAVLMDIEMPGIDGYETVRQLRRAETPGGPRQYIIALTAHAMEGVREKCLAAGMDDFLTKPIQFEVLRDTLQRCPVR